MTAQILLVKGNQKEELSKQNKSTQDQRTHVRILFQMQIKYTMQIKEIMFYLLKGKGLGQVLVITAV